MIQLLLSVQRGLALDCRRGVKLWEVSLSFEFSSPFPLPPPLGFAPSLFVSLSIVLLVSSPLRLFFSLPFSLSSPASTLPLVLSFEFGLMSLAPGMGSVSKFAVSHSPVPVIVVRLAETRDTQENAYTHRPERKVKKTLEKRQNNPKRGQYAALLGQEGLSLSRSRSRGSIGGLSEQE